MAGISMGGVALIVLVNLSPHGPSEVPEGSFWKYRLLGAGECTMRVIEVSPGEAGTSLQVEVSMNDTALPLRTTLSQDSTSGGREKLFIQLPELKPGSRLSIPGEGTATITAVRPCPTSTAAGDFPEAIEVSLAVENDADGTMVLAPGAGLLAFRSEGRTMMELTDYGPRSVSAPPGSQLAPPQDPPVIPVPETGPFSPALAVLDENTFVVADPAARTVTVFRVVRSDRGDWRVEPMATARYGPGESTAASAGAPSAR
jgi:hypothetical protein